MRRSSFRGTMFFFLFQHSIRQNSDPWGDTCALMDGNPLIQHPGTVDMSSCVQRAVRRMSRSQNVRTLRLTTSRQHDHPPQKMLLDQSINQIEVHSIILVRCRLIHVYVDQHPMPLVSPTTMVSTGSERRKLAANKSDRVLAQVESLALARCVLGDLLGVGMEKSFPGAASRRIPTNAPLLAINRGSATGIIRTSAQKAVRQPRVAEERRGTTTVFKRNTRVYSHVLGEKKRKT